MEDVEAACTVPAGRLAELIKNIAAINKARIVMSRFVFLMDLCFVGWIVFCFVIYVYIIGVCMFIF